MDGLGAGRLAGRDDPFGDEIALRGRRRADMHGLVGHLDMHGVAVGVRIDRDRRDPHPPRRPDDPAGDLAAVGDQDFPEHAARFLVAERQSFMELLEHWLNSNRSGRSRNASARRGTATDAECLAAMRIADQRDAEPLTASSTEKSRHAIAGTTIAIAELEKVDGRKGARSRNPATPSNELHRP